MLIISLGSHLDVQYVVDFAPELYEIITETKYMEQLGFHVPELARNVSLQVSNYACAGLIRDDPYWTSTKNNLELIKLSSINKVSLV